MLPRANTRPLPAQLAPFLTGTGTEPVDLKAMVVGSQVSIDLRQSIVKTLWRSQVEAVRSINSALLPVLTTLSFTRKCCQKPRSLPHISHVTISFLLRLISMSEAWRRIDTGFVTRTNLSLSRKTRKFVCSAPAARAARASGPVFYIRIRCTKLSVEKKSDYKIPNAKCFFNVNLSL